LTHRVLQVFADAFQFREPPHVATLLAKLELIAEAPPRLARGGVGRKTAPLTDCGEHLDMKLHLIVEILQAAPAGQEKPETPQDRHAICNTRAIAPATR
jgi:hypothetical protein